MPKKTIPFIDCLTLTRTELANAVSQRLCLPYYESRKLVQTVFELMAEALERGENVRLTNFGNFILRDKKERPGFNPKTMEKVSIAPMRVVTFHPSATLKKVIQDGNH